MRIDLPLWLPVSLVLKKVIESSFDSAHEFLRIQKMRINRNNYMNCENI